MAKTIAGKILSAVFSLFRDNWPSFVAKLINKVPDDVKEQVSIGIMIVERAKTWLGGDVAKFITHIIPGDLDEAVRLKLIDIACIVLSIDENVTGLGAFTLNNKEAHMMASDFNQHITGFTFGQSALTTEVVYQSLKADGKLD